MRSLKINRAAFVMGGLPLSYMLNDALMFEVESIYITPYKVVLLLSAAFLFESFLLFYQTKKNILSSISVFFIGYCLLILISVFYSGGLAISQKINYCLIISSEIIIIIGLTKKYSLNPAVECHHQGRLF